MNNILYKIEDLRDVAVESRTDQDGNTILKGSFTIWIGGAVLHATKIEAHKVVDSYFVYLYNHNEYFGSYQYMTDTGNLF